MKITKMTQTTLALCMLIPVFTHAQTVLEQLDAANKAFAKAIVAGDIEHLVNDYTDDACIIAPNTPPACGKEAIRSFWTAVLESKPKDVEIVTLKAEQSGNLSYATGDLIITDADSAVHKNRFVAVFKLGDGAWKLHVDSWTPQ
jgi:ketosteroid isomerase-like protein